MPTQPPYNLVRDPLFYITVIFFGLITTAPPALIGQPLFMPLAQAVSLTLFAALAVRRGTPRQALAVVGLWLVIQFGLILTLTWLAPTRLDLALADGFNLRTAYLQGFYTGDALPRTLLTAPGIALGEAAGVLAGSLLSGGLVGAFFLVRAVNFAAFGMGGLLAAEASIFAALPVWTLCKLLGYAGFFVLFSRPLLTGDFAPRAILGQDRPLLRLSAGLLLAGLLLELFLPGLWSGWFAP